MSKPLWTSQEIAEATGGVATGEFEASGLSIDTRSLQAGDLFVALKDARDGHDFVGAAFEAGASGALVSRPIEDGPYILVDDVLEALTALGIAARKRAYNCYRVAITGSVGKTSVKEMIARIFRAKGRAHWNERSFNNQWGVPLTLARMPADTQFAVFEIGMNSPGEIAPRSRMVAPHAAIITKIAAAHLEGVGSLSGVAREKADIFVGLMPEGKAILPYKDKYSGYLSGRATSAQQASHVQTFGDSEAATASVEKVETTGATTIAQIRIHGSSVQVELNAVGEHWAVNAAIALLAACPDEPDGLDHAANALSGYAPPPGRGTAEALALPGGGEFTLVDDAYNANPESMRAALSGFGARPSTGKRILALGEMLEVGATSAQEHAALAEPLLATGASKVFLAGAGMAPLVDALGERIESVWADKADGLDSELKETLKAGDLLLLKGSNASGMGRLADRLRQWSAAADQQVMDRDAECVAGGTDAV